jgi:hypothetical protein
MKIVYWTLAAALLVAMCLPLNALGAVLHFLAATLNDVDLAMKLVEESSRK